MTKQPAMNGKIVLISGATGGIGRVAAEALAGMGAAVTLIGRSPQKTAQAVAEIRAAANNPQVEGLTADLSSLAEVRRIAEAFRERQARLDVLINNAGAVFMQRQVSVDGFEMTFALNHLNYFLLTNLLLDRLAASGSARVVNVSSRAHYPARLNFDDLQNVRSFNGWIAYSQSKLANVYFTYELARRLEGSQATANALHPGFVATNFGRNNGGFFGAVIRLSQIAAISPQEGARTILYLASSPQVEGVSGKYFAHEKERPSSKASYDLQAAQRLWEISRQLTGLAGPAAPA